MIYGFIKAHKEEFPIGKMCKVLGVSRSGYYHWLNRKPSKRALENAALIERICKIHEKSHQRYGSPRITEQLKGEGREVSRPRVARLMKEANIQANRQKKYKQTTDSNHDLPIAPNLLQRNFEADRLAMVWVSDLTYLWTEQGWVYLTVITIWQIARSSDGPSVKA